MMLELNTIHLGDCQELMKEIPDGSIDLILQDPPYNTTACKWEWDIMTVIDELWREWKRIIKPNGAIVMTASQPFTSKLVMSNLKMFKYEWIWDKVKPSTGLHAKIQPLRQHENILVFGGTQYYPQMEKAKQRVDKPRIAKNGEAFGGKEILRQHKNNGLKYPRSIVKMSNADQTNRLSPTQKPVALFEYLICTYTNEGDTVFDGFSGSGTTAIACRNLNRNFICIEKDYDYWYLSMERLAQ